jgi:hypothetical protein
MQIMPSAQNFLLWFDRWRNNYARVVLTAVQDAVKWHATVCFPELGQLHSGMFGLLP